MATASLKLESAAVSVASDPKIEGYGNYSKSSLYNSTIHMLSV